MWLYPPTEAGTIFSPQPASSAQEAIANALGQKLYLRVLPEAKSRAGSMVALILEESLCFSQLIN